jgi:type IV secretory pathway VirB3-like protein
MSKLGVVGVCASMSIIELLLTYFLAGSSYGIWFLFVFVALWVVAINREEMVQVLVQKEVDKMMKQPVPPEQKSDEVKL